MDDFEQIRQAGIGAFVVTDLPSGERVGGYVAAIDHEKRTVQIGAHLVEFPPKEEPK